MKKIIGIVLFSTTLCVAMDNNNVEQLIEKKSDPLEVIRGTLVIQTLEGIRYSPFAQKGIKKALNMEMKASDPLVSIRAFEGDGSSKSPLYLPGFAEFPEMLPLSKLRDKKDGGELTFILAKQKEKQIILTCNQKIQKKSAVEESLAYCKTSCIPPHTHLYGADSFEAQLAYCITVFKKKPNFHLFDEEDLVAQGIIVKCGEGYQHGPNGYKFD